MPGGGRWRGGPHRQSSQRQSGNRDRAQGGYPGRHHGGPPPAWQIAAANNAANSHGNNQVQNHNSAHDQHSSVNKFNAEELKNVMKSGSKARVYRPIGKNPASDKAWGQKPHAMANGKDFLTELRKQIGTLKRRGPPIGG
ncbi:hypothetical protein N7532_006308 [Penicillium argentinense]|uniref:Uncharacterized protein n=1 Tax=Penicillium argentinense TaxID=1131581 RepID=A0A9W9FG08_9EURO|nr:uncharacterized protein N7532_006308 [Penicillium argentinense]KAJ5099307.1 hypothetical protein N7532_006308 [Penicillium argentinense]